MIARTLGSLGLIAWLGVLPGLVPAAEPVYAAQNAATQVAAPATSRIVYESIRDDATNIYIADGDGTNERHLTDAGTDYLPRLNRGASEVVFVSERDGNPEIYRINVDGSGLRRLTNDAALDSEPAWSPDGQTIVFVRATDDDADVYTMDRDGGNVQRLSDDAMDELDPVFSRDGAKIAWVKRVPMGNNSWTGRLWTMNSDGSNKRAISEDLPQLSRPAWSPLGDQLTVGSRSNLITTIWLIPETGGFENAYISLRDTLGRVTVFQNGGWSPDGEYLYFTILYFRQEMTAEGSVVNVLDETAVVRQKLGATASEQITTGTFDRSADWQSRDITAPTSDIVVLSAYSRIGETTLNWRGSDDLSGIKSYDIQYRDYAGAWATFLANVTTTSVVATRSLLPNRPTDTPTAFRVRARDNALNVEPWPTAATGDTATTFYAGLIAGHVVDNRGYPVPDAAISIESLHAIPGRNSDADGRFEAYLSFVDNNELVEAQANHAGYGRTPKKRLPGQVDVAYNPYLPPLDNRIANGTFEADGTPLPSWKRSGDLAAIASTGDVYSGSYGAAVGRRCTFPCLADAVPVEASNHGFLPALVAAPDGVIHAIWYEDVFPDSPAGGIMYSTLQTDGMWAAPQVIGQYQMSTDPGDYYLLGTQLVRDQRGVLHASFGSIDGTYYTSQDARGVWQTPQLLGPVHNARLAADKRGGVHVSYVRTQFVEGRTRKESFYIRRTANGNWSSAVKLSQGDWSTIPSIAVSAADDVYVAWVERVNRDGIDSELVVRTFGADGKVTNFREGADEVTPQLVADPQGGVYMVYKNGYRVLTADAGWTSFQLLGDRQSSATTLHVAANPQGGFTVLGNVTNEPSELPQLLFTRWEVQTGRVTTGKGVDAGTFTLDADSNIHLLRWDQDNLLYQGPQRAAAASFNAISQSVTVPRTMNEPTLSFMYALKNVDPTSRFTVLVADDSTQTTVSTRTAESDWTQGSVDLSMWSGKTITITFALNQGAGEPYAQLALDDVTVGSWNTPVISSVAPQRLDARSGQTFTITGENFIETPTVTLDGLSIANVERVNGQTLRVTLPSGVASGRLDLVVTNPGGQQAARRNALQIGYSVSLPLIQR